SVRWAGNGSQPAPVSRWPPARNSGDGGWDHTGGGDEAGVRQLERSHSPPRPRRRHLYVLVTGRDVDLLLTRQRCAAGDIQRPGAGWGRAPGPGNRGPARRAFRRNHFGCPSRRPAADKTISLLSGNRKAAGPSSPVKWPAVSGIAVVCSRWKTRPGVGQDTRGNPAEAGVSGSRPLYRIGATTPRPWCRGTGLDAFQGRKIGDHREPGGNLGSVSDDAAGRASRPARAVYGEP